MPIVTTSFNNPISDNCSSSESCSKNSNADSGLSYSLENQCLAPSAHAKKNHLPSCIIREINSGVTTRKKE